jgi:hypothetical protein
MSSVQERLENLRCYIQSLKSRCRCEELMMDDDPCGALCGFCEEKVADVLAALPPAPARSARSAAQVFAVEMAFIREKVEQVSRTKSVRLRVKTVRQLFTELLGYQRFLAATPIIRESVVKKMAEFRAQPLASSLLPLFDQTDAMLATLSARPDYRA